MSTKLVAVCPHCGAEGTLALCGPGKATAMWGEEYEEPLAQCVRTEDPAKMVTKYNPDTGDPYQVSGYIGCGAHFPLASVAKGGN